MELSHKRARFELEKAASDSARDLEVQITNPHIHSYLYYLFVVTFSNNINLC